MSFTREIIGEILGWTIITVAAWFLALAIMGYGLGSIFPWDWPVDYRFYHLGIQLALIVVYALWRRDK